MSKKQFTLDSWLKNKSQKVVTRCGFPVRIVCTDVKRKDYPILALVERDDQEEYQSFTKDGRFSLYNPLHDNFDLFIETADEVSEDEKIRKEIINYFHCQSEEEPTRKEIHDKWIAWIENIPVIIDHEKREGFHLGYKVCLERQGEKPNPYSGTSFEYNGHIWGMCARDNGVDISCDKHLIKHLEKQGEQEKDILEDAILDGYILDDDEDGLIAETIRYKNEKQGEQKPADSYCQENCKGFQETGKCFTDGMCNAKREAEQKPEENKGNIGGISPNWSEEDEHRLNSCLNILQPKTFVGNIETINTKWLKSLKNRVQPKQEWSEEDERERKRVVGLLEGWLSTFKETCYAEDCKCGIGWLKSLRPQNRWKPSDEQMRILDLAIRGGINHGTREETTLVSLLNDLKKLKEK